MLPDGRHPRGDFVQLVQDRQQPADAEVQLFDQPDDLVAAGDEPAPGLPLFGGAAAAAHGDAEVELVEPQQVLERDQVRDEPLEHAFLFGRVGHRDFDRAVEAQLAVLDLFQQVDRPLQHEVVAQQRAAEAGPRGFDRLGRGDFLLPIEHRDFAHLHQVHADRVVDVRFAAAADGIEVDFDVGVVVVRRFVGIDETRRRRRRGRRRAWSTSSLWPLSGSSKSETAERGRLPGLAAPFDRLAVLAGDGGHCGSGLVGVRRTGISSRCAGTSCVVVTAANECTAGANDGGRRMRRRA